LYNKSELMIDSSQTTCNTGRWWWGHLTSGQHRVTHHRTITDPYGDHALQLYDNTVEFWLPTHVVLGQNEARKKYNHAESHEHSIN
jgi:hypothetical protein